MLNENNIDGVLYMTSPDIDTPHAFTTRIGGVSEGIYKSLNLGQNLGDKRENVQTNYDCLCNAIGITNDDLVFSRQVHEANIRVVRGADRGSLKCAALPCADGLITNEPNVALTVFTADCVPILLYDPVNRVIGAVHSGWRGTAANIAGIAIKKMESEFGCEGANIIAAIGPCISKCCFETDNDVVDSMKNCLGDIASQCYDAGDTKFFVDLKKANQLLLINAGVKSIAISNECTYCSGDTYWSHRRLGTNRGSQAAVITMQLSEL